MSNAKPKPTFYLAVLILVVGLVALALWRFGALPGMGEGARFSDEEMQQLNDVEAPDNEGITTVKEYAHVPATKLPEVQGLAEHTRALLEHDPIYIDYGTYAKFRGKIKKLD